MWDSEEHENLCNERLVKENGKLPLDSQTFSYNIFPILTGRITIIKRKRKTPSELGKKGL